MADFLAVINTSGQVWARRLDLSGGNIGAGEEVTGPSLFPKHPRRGYADRYVYKVSDPASQLDYIGVVTGTGAVSEYILTSSVADPGFALQLAESNLFGAGLFGGPDAKYVLSVATSWSSPNLGCGVYVINNAGEVWAHLIPVAVIEKGTKLNGPTLFGAADDKYVVTTGGSILVVNTKGEVWAHDLTKSSPNLACPDSVGGGYKLSGPSLFGGSNDKYVVYYGGYLLVINTLGEVWAHHLTGSAVAVGPS